MPDAVTAPPERRIDRAPLVTIRPQSGWLGVAWGELWAHRDLWWMLAMRDIRVRYKQTLLGAAWAVLQPLIGMLVFTAVFGRSLGVADRLPAEVLARFDGRTAAYAVFAYAGLLPWTFFSATVSGGARSLLDNTRIMTKVYFPRALMPLGVLGYTTLDLLVASAILAVLMVAVGVAPGASVVLLPVLLAGVVAAAVGVGVLLAAATVKYRDVQFVIAFLVQIWLFCTPVIYPATLIPERWRWLLFANPMAGLIEAIRACLLGTPLDWTATGVALAVALLFFSVGMLYFRQVEDYFADIV